MHIISRTRLREFWRIHPKSETGLRYWNKLTCQHLWNSFEDVRKTFPSADLVDNRTVFDICGNHYRIIAYIDYSHHKVFVRQILTHSEYDKEKWKKDKWFK